MTTAGLMHWTPTPSWNTAEFPPYSQPASDSMTPAYGPDSSYAEKCILDQMPLVKSIARNIHRRLPTHIAYEDLVQAGVLGLIDAAKRFNPERQIQFATFARHRIRGAIMDSLRMWDWASRSLRRKQKTVACAREHLSKRLGRDATEEELADYLSVSLEELQQMLSDIQNPTLANLDSEEENSARTLEEIIEADPDSNPFCQCSAQETKALLLRCIRAMSERERKILTLHYINGFTMKEVGQCIGVGQSRISGLHAQAIDALRLSLQAMFKTQLHSRVL